MLGKVLLVLLLGAGAWAIPHVGEKKKKGTSQTVTFGAPDPDLSKDWVIGDGNEDETAGVVAGHVAGQAPAKFDDTAAAKVFDASDDGPKVSDLAEKGWHFQLARGKKSSPYHDSVAAGAEVATPLDRLWANKDPAGDVESMAENGQSAETIAAKLSGDKANYHNSFGWMAQMKQTIKQITEHNDHPQTKPVKRSGRPREQRNKLEQLDGFIALEMEAKEKSTGKTQRAGTVFAALDTNHNGKLENQDAPSVVELLKKFDLERVGVDFNAFKQGVRDHRTQSKRAAIREAKAAKALKTVAEAKNYVPHKKLATTPVGQLKKMPGTLPNGAKAPKQLASAPRP